MKVKEYIKELRSGKYKQSTGQLSEINPSGERCYCALGVLQVMYNDAHGLEWDRSDDDLSTPMSDDVKRWSGIDYDLNYLDDYKIYEMNDDLEMSFEEIADALEEVL